MTASNEWGRVDTDGTVYVRTATASARSARGTRGAAEDGLAHFARRYDDLATEVGLLESRLASGAGDPKATLAHATPCRRRSARPPSSATSPALDDRLTASRAAAQAKLRAGRRGPAAARAAAAAAKEKLVLEAEELPESSQWKATGDRFRAIVEEWKADPRRRPQGRRAAVEAFAAARDDVHPPPRQPLRRAGRAARVARARKEQLVAEAESLADSTEWGPTASRLKAL